ncbi:MAG: serine hydrolase, partial [Clostridia bacterium]
KNNPLTLPEMIPQSLTDKLEKRLNNQTFCCAMYYLDLETGFTITYNSDRLFGAASLIKAPYLYFIFDRISKGELSLDKVFTYKKSIHYFGGTGTVNKLPDGSKLTLRQIIEHIFYESDNSAFRMLYNGTDGIMTLMDFHSKAVKEFDSPFLSGTYGSVLNASGVAKIFTKVYERSKTEELFAWYIDLMKHANENKFVRGGLPVDENSECIYEVAHKYGMDIKSSNDAAIVFYEDRPYILIILTDYLGINTESFMNRISSDVYAIHQYITAKNN